ncbi:MAG: transcriptional regulator [Solirubrobacterales bacterium]|nr:transcriptional regulator [Solirubrobacterales bacterium]MBV9533907.1 transcriptional regulator [Solirubrobacterales bacterium]
MDTFRTYGDGCAIAYGLDLVGERWALLVVRELLLGPKRYTDLRGGLPNASPNVLSQRLGELERAGIVRRRKLPPPAGSRVYELTEWGRGLEEIVVSLGNWAERERAGLPSGVPIGADSVILALRSRFAPRADGLRAGYELRLGVDRFRIEIAGAEIEISRDADDRVDATVDTDPDTLASVLWGGQPLRTAQRSGKMKIEGDKKAVERFMRLFPIPTPTANPEAAGELK